MSRLDELLDELAAELRKRLSAPSKPSVPSLTQTGKSILIMLHYKLHLPEVPDKDVTKWELETTLNGGNPSQAEVAEGAPLDFNQGDQVTLRLRDYDDANNASEWSDPLTFTATDTLPPSKPGQPTLELVSED